MKLVMINVNFVVMRKMILIFVVIPSIIFAKEDSLAAISSENNIVSTDSVAEDIIVDKQKDEALEKGNIIEWRLKQLDKNSPMDLRYNEKVHGC